MEAEERPGRLPGLGSLFSCAFCILVSLVRTERSFSGGAAYLCIRAAGGATAAWIRGDRGCLSRAERWLRTGATLLLIPAAAILLVRLVKHLNEGGDPVLALVAVSAALRDLAGRQVIRLRAADRLSRRGLALSTAAIHGAALLAVLISVPGTMSAGQAAVLAAGYVLCGLLVFWADRVEARDWRRAQQEAADAAQTAALREKLRGGNACRVHRVLAGLTTAALYLSCTALPPLLTMPDKPAAMAQPLIAIFLAAAAVPAVLGWHRRRKGREPDAVNLCLVGFPFWLVGLGILRHMAARGELAAGPWAGAALCVGGAALCLTALCSLERDMHLAARFTAEGDTAGYDALRAASLDLAVLTGQTLAGLQLAALLLENTKNLGLFQGTVGWILLQPALLLTLAALVCLFCFPISARYFDKLRRHFRLAEAGENNRALKDRLTQVVVQPFRQPFATRLLRAVIRNVYRQRLRGLENIRVDDENPMVFLCNHSEIYGPVISICCLPVPVRPWVISRIAITTEESIDYIHRYDTSKWGWLPGKWRRPAARLLARLGAWCMNQLECVPVYRDKPGQLMKTFRASVEALQAGDNLLIFPENPNAVAQDHGYEREGVGTLFSGFAMLGQIYHSRTGKRCRFVPVFCDKHTRTITFAPEIVYREDADPEEERRRVAAVCEAEMNRIWQEQHGAQENSCPADEGK